MIILYIIEKTFSRYKQQAFSTKKILKRHIMDCFKQRIIMPKEDEYVKFRNYERKTKLLFLIYADFVSILVSEDNEKQN